MAVVGWNLKRLLMRGATGSEFAYVGSLLGLLAFLQAVIPREVWSVLRDWVRVCFAWAWFYVEAEVHELDGSSSNEVYEAVRLHVAGLTSDRCDSSRRLIVSKLKGAARPSFRPAKNEKVLDSFQGASFCWVYHEQQQYQQRGSSYWGGQVRGSDDEQRYFTLTFHRRYRGLLQDYLDYIIKHAAELDHLSRTRRLFTNAPGDGRRLWESVPFKHPSTFETIAMEEQLKRRIVEDLAAFRDGEGFYHRVGRAWKRGYLLYGPPGTGKSSLIAAIANYTRYDVYDLELAEVRSNAELRKLLMHVKNRSIIVIEDIDCSLDLNLKNRAEQAKDKEAEIFPVDDEVNNSSRGDNRRGRRNEKEVKDDRTSRVTLSGVLNFTDGLWSAIGGERILIFTTNHKEQLDPALLRSGRMDLHILLSHCCYEAFKVLASTYLQMSDHDLFGEVEALLERVQITPADVAEVFIQHKNCAGAALECLIRLLVEREQAGALLLPVP